MPIHFFKIRMPQENTTNTAGAHKTEITRRSSELPLSPLYTLNSETTSEHMWLVK